MDNIERVIHLIEEFAVMHRFDVSIFQHSVADLRGVNEVPDKYWATFERESGVYLIADPLNSSTKYIGMSTKGAGKRMYKWMFEDNKVSRGISETDIVLSVVTADHNYMAPALELYLIQKLNPTINTVGKTN